MDEYTSKVGLTVLLFFFPVILVIRGWARSHGALEASMRVVRVASSLYLIFVCTEHVDIKYVNAHIANNGHPPEEGEREDVFAIMHAWCQVAGINLASVLISALFDKNRPQTRLLCAVHIALLERLVSVFVWENPSCFGRILTDAGTGLLVSVCAGATINSMVGKDGMLARLVWWTRTTIAAFLVSQMIVYIAIHMTSEKSQGTKSQEFQIYFACWQILTIVTNWSLGFIPNDIYIKEA